MLGMRGPTLSTYATVSGDTNSLADPVLDLSYVLVLSTIVVLLLRFVKDGVVPRGHQCRHEDPFRDRRAVDAAGSRDRDVGVFDYRMVCPGVDPGGKDMDKLDTAATSATN